MTEREFLRKMTNAELVDFFFDRSKKIIGIRVSKNDCIKYLQSEHIEEVKPCPCCGGKAEILYDSDDNRFGYIRCTKCNISTNYDSIDNILQIWNQRLGDK